MKTYCFIAFLSLSCIVLKAQENKVPQSFSHLNKTELDLKYYPENMEKPAVFFNKDFSSIINKDIDSSSVFYNEYAMMVGLYEVIVTRINKASEQEYHIMFDLGPSMDPNFSIYKMENGKPQCIASLKGIKLFIPGNGNIYCEGHTNNYFNERKKYTLKNDELTEVEQAYKYVGINTKTSGLLRLYADKDCTKRVAVLPKGAEVEVLLNEGNYYLVKTSFGLVGWWKYDLMGNNAIDAIYFNGD